ncbi:hypothetical protein P7K49_031024 [Saguinus oedipus]|uniref:Uncharacterized protein n=1 Tax=Saguinus oedipus TaxID=9490 RepID=A0ABQ9U4N5_SAGOE|nr:hypothetical protein P7K49_031024 [Saguinus oedipus]
MKPWDGEPSRSSGKPGQLLHVVPHLCPTCSSPLYLFQGSKTWEQKRGADSKHHLHLHLGNECCGFKDKDKDLSVLKRLKINQLGWRWLTGPSYAADSRDNSHPPKLAKHTLPSGTDECLLYGDYPN